MTLGNNIKDRDMAFEKVCITLVLVIKVLKWG